MPVSRDSTIRGTCRISREGFRRCLLARSAKPVLDERDPGEYYDAILKIGVDPLFVAAIFQAESGMGGGGWAVKTRSWGNTRPPSFVVAPVGYYAQDSGAFFPFAKAAINPPPRALCAYASWYHGCISTAARLRDHPAYQGKNLGQVIQTWAPASDGNDPERYIQQVLNFMNFYADLEESVPQIVQKFIKGNFWPGRNGLSAQALVLHVAEGGRVSTESWFNNPASEASAHYLVCKDGAIWQFVKEEDTAWANGKLNKPNPAEPLIADWQWAGINPNRVTISVETERTWQERLTAPQLASLAWLAADIHRRYGWPTDGSRLLGHNEFDSVDRARCPSLSREEWDAIIKAVKGGTPLVEAKKEPTLPARPAGFLEPVVTNTDWGGAGVVVYQKVRVYNPLENRWYEKEWSGQGGFTQWREV